MSMNDIGQQVLIARKKQHMTQADLGQLLGMSRATISGIERGTVSDIGIRKILAICATLGLELVASPRQQRPTLQQLMQANRDA